MVPRPLPRRLRLALLKCDTPHERIVAVQGDYLDIFRNYLTRSCEIYNRNLGPGGAGGVGPAASAPVDSEEEWERIEFELDGYDVVHKMEYPEMEKYDGVILTGSAASAYDSDQWISDLVSFLSKSIETYPQIPIVGICFGHQIMSRVLGGKVEPNVHNGVRYWETGVYEVALTQTGKELFATDHLNIQQLHRDCVPWSSLASLDIPHPPQTSGIASPASTTSVITKRGAIHLLGTTPLTTNQGFVVTRPSAPPISPLSPITSSRSLHSSIQIFCVQGHPEFDAFFLSTVIDLRGPNGSGVMSAETAADGLERATRRHDGDIVIGSVIWKILAANARERERVARELEATKVMAATQAA